MKVNLIFGLIYSLYVQEVDIGLRFDIGGSDLGLIKDADHCLSLTTTINVRAKILTRQWCFSEVNYLNMTLFIRWGFYYRRL